MEYVSVQQIATREKKGGQRIVIKPNSRFRSEDYPMISDAEWKAMLSGEHPAIRLPDDPAFVSPAQQRAADGEPVTERRSPRTDLASQAAAAAKREDGGEGDGEGDGEGEGSGDEPVPARAGRRRQRAADDEV